MAAWHYDRAGTVTAVAGPRVTRPEEAGISVDARLPLGIAIDFDQDTRQMTSDVLFGGSPARVLRLSAAGLQALAELRAGSVISSAGAALARRLTDTGLAHPRPRRALAEPDVTVVVPVRDRAGELGRCLKAAGDRYPVLVVDDGSADPSAVAAVCAARGARPVRRPDSGGPGPARNTALRMIGTALVAFLDSDCIPPPGWISALTGHFADPLVAAAAPRIVGTDQGVSALDLGDRPARVAPLTRVAYVPTAALLLRRSALGDGFDEALRYGEDVDLAWRLIAAGGGGGPLGGGGGGRSARWVREAHGGPQSRPDRLRRRFRYGTSAAPLTRRHPGSVTPAVLDPEPAAALGAPLAPRPL